ncbi:MAG: hypothetical protein KA207_10705 [Burkholderiaceae bacterium]|jgi:hypothetical protein|nr:hypothetical protein [Burkholderiaceae bacterium]
MTVATSFEDRAFMVTTIARAHMRDKARAHYFASRLIELCACVAEAGGGDAEMIHSVTEFVEKCPANERVFARHITERCADISRRLGPMKEGAASVVIRDRFNFLQELIEQDDRDRDIWCSENPMAFAINIQGQHTLSYEQWLAAGDCFMEVMNAQIGDNNAIVAAHDDVLENGPESPEARRWEMAIELAKASALEGFPPQPLIEFEEIFYWTM